MSPEQAQAVVDVLPSAYWIISFLVVNMCIQLFILFFVALKAGKS